MTRLVELACVALLAVGCHPRAGGGDALRIGFFPTVTHAAALVMLERGELARSIAPARVEPRAFRSGPEAMEALFAGAIDACYVGPLPALNAWMRSGGEVRIVAGAASGGAAFVVAPGAGITDAASLHGKKLATPQLGNSQDVALRTWLFRNGLRSTDRGGDVQVMPLANPDILSLMRLGKLDGAWVVEPWVARLRHEAGARLFLDERTLWPGGRYPTALLVVTRTLLERHPDRVQKLLSAHVEAVRFIAAHPDDARAIVADQIAKYAGRRLPPDELADAWAHIEVTWDPLAGTLDELAADGRRLDYLPEKGEPRAAVDRRFLDQAVAR